MFASRNRHAAMALAKISTTTRTIAVHVRTNAPETWNVAEGNAKTSTGTTIVTADLAEMYALRVIAVAETARIRIPTNQTAVCYASLVTPGKHVAAGRA
jgi:myo-inositol-1-phosphate synthase